MIAPLKQEAVSVVIVISACIVELITVLLIILSLLLILFVYDNFNALFEQFLANFSSEKDQQTMY